MAAGNVPHHSDESHDGGLSDRSENHRDADENGGSQLQRDVGGADRVDLNKRTQDERSPEKRLSQKTAGRGTFGECAIDDIKICGKHKDTIVHLNNGLPEKIETANQSWQRDGKNPQLWHVQDGASQFTLKADVRLKGDNIYASVKYENGNEATFKNGTATELKTADGEVQKIAKGHFNAKTGEMSDPAHESAHVKPEQVSPFTKAEQVTFSPGNGGPKEMTAHEVAHVHEAPKQIPPPELPKPTPQHFVMPEAPKPVPAPELPKPTAPRHVDASMPKPEPHPPREMHELPKAPLPKLEAVPDFAQRQAELFAKFQAAIPKISESTIPIPPLPAAAPEKHVNAFPVLKPSVLHTGALEGAPMPSAHKAVENFQPQLVQQKIDLGHSDQNRLIAPIYRKPEFTNPAAPAPIEASNKGPRFGPTIQENYQKPVEHHDAPAPVRAGLNREAPTFVQPSVPKETQSPQDKRDAIEQPQPHDKKYSATISKSDSDTDSGHGGDGKPNKVFALGAKINEQHQAPRIEGAVDYSNYKPKMVYGDASQQYNRGGSGSGADRSNEGQHSLVGGDYLDSFNKFEVPRGALSANAENGHQVIINIYNNATGRYTGTAYATLTGQPGASERGLRIDDPPKWRGQTYRLRKN